MFSKARTTLHVHLFKDATWIAQLVQGEHFKHPSLRWYGMTQIDRQDTQHKKKDRMEGLIKCQSQGERICQGWDSLKEDKKREAISN